MEKSPVERYKPILACLLVVMCAAVVYVQVAGHEFISYDDSIYVTNNTYVKAGLTAENVKRAFLNINGCSSRTYYHPLTWVSHMLDIKLYGLNPGMHHLTNAILHLINIALLFAVLFYATGSLWASVLASSLFGLHPINVDSVAWLAERKNLLSASFWMLSVLAYISYARKAGVMRYLAALAAFALGLLAKPSIVALPGVLLLLDFWPLKRVWLDGEASGKSFIGGIRSRVSFTLLAAEKLPFVILSVLSVYVSNLSLHNMSVPTSLVPMSLRLENAVVSCVKYLWKMWLPIDLSFFYPYPDFVPLWKVTGSAVVILAVTYAAVREMSRRPYILFGWLWYLGTIFPVLGIMQGGQWPEIAERWAYIPLIGIYVIISWGALEIIGHLKSGAARGSAAALVTAVVFLMTVLTWNQIGYWKNDFTLFTHGISANENNFVAYNNLGNAFYSSNKLDEALVNYTKAISKSPTFAEPHYNLGVIYLRKNDPGKAEEFFKKALELNPQMSDTYFSLGILCLESGKFDEAVKNLTQSIQMHPDDPEAHFNLAMAYYKKGDIDAAINSFEKAIQIDPKYAEAHYNLGVMFVQKQNMQKAMDEFSQALVYNPRHKEARYNLGMALSGLNRMDEAILHYEKALEIDPGFAQARQQLAMEKDKKAKLENAVGNLEAGLKANPGNLDALNKLAVYYSLLGKEDQAMSSLREIVRIKPSSPDAYYNMSCLYAKANKIDESLSSLNNAISLGFKNWNLLKTDKDLDNIRATEPYERLMSRVGK